MREFAFRILNVFTWHTRRFSGNPLAVFENGSYFSDEQMQSIARQFNLSETTFILPGTPDHSARVRIFTPAHEMPFAGHPTLGTAHVVRSMRGGDRLRLQMNAGTVEVRATGDHWELQAPRPPETHPPKATRAELSKMLGLPTRAVEADPLWVDTGTEQLVIPLAKPEDVASAAPDPALLGRYGVSAKRSEACAYVWARTSPTEVLARFFFLERQSVVEDPATGSACANLGGWMVATGQPLPVKLMIRQGEATGRPSLLRLTVEADKSVRVGGDVLEVARGMFAIEP